MSGARYHPDEAMECHPAREAWRSGRTSVQASRALAMKEARKFICANPGCKFAEIKKATGARHTQLLKLAGMGLVSFTQKKLPDGTAPQLWYPKAMESFVADQPPSLQLHRAVPPSTDVEAQNLRPQGCEGDSLK